jgi:exopolysaccharide biosynthesis polyprenyl glycosylphosphotransferase
LTSLAVVLGILFLSRELFDSRFIILASWFLATLFIVFERLLVRSIQRLLLRSGIGLRTVALIGDLTTAQVIQRGFEMRPSLGYRIVAVFERFTDDTRKALLALKQNGRLDDVILTNPNAPREEAADVKFFTDTEHVGFQYSADLFASTTKTEMHTYAGVPVLEIKKTPLDGWGAIEKRLFDILVSSLLILLTLPLQALIAIALFMEQPGRVLFSRMPNGTKTLRVGEAGRLFHFFKFRSMVKNAHALRSDRTFLERYGNERSDSPLFKLKNDPRVTPIGKIIRRLSLDEIPEFYLVFLGRMSLVGPRPHLPEEVAKYAPHERRVLAVKPGITGMAQVSGRADISFQEEVRLDLFYIEHWSPLLDIAVMVKTLFAVLRRRGAY